MFDPRLPIALTENIDAVIAIKQRVSKELQGFSGDINTEYHRLFQIYASQDPIVSKIKNI